MANNIYIGNRYVPKFANPVEWDNLRSYEPLTIVTYEGTSYTSKKPVPAGVELNNTDYWVVTGNYNEQVETYRKEVETLKKETNVLYVLDFIKNTDNGDLGLAIQRAVDMANNWVENSTEIILPKGVFLFKTPVVIKNKEGIIIKGAGKYNTVLKASGDLLFNDNLGLADDYNVNAFFIVPKTRTLKDTGTVVNEAEYEYVFKDFSMVDTLKRKKIHGIFTHGLAHASFENIYVNGLTYMFNALTRGSWVTRYIKCSADFCISLCNVTFGTSNYYNSCSIGDCDRGFYIDTVYSTVENCTCEMWSKGNYAYASTGYSVNFIGCGCERGVGGIFKAYTGVNGYPSITIIGCTWYGNSQNYEYSASQQEVFGCELVDISGHSRITIINSDINTNSATVGDYRKCFPIKVKEASRIDLHGGGRLDGSIGFYLLKNKIYELFDFMGSSSININTICSASFTATGNSIGFNNEEFTKKPFVEIKHIYNCECDTENSKISVKNGGVYRISISGYLKPDTDSTNDYIVIGFTITGQENKSVTCYKGNTNGEIYVDVKQPTDFSPYIIATNFKGYCVNPTITIERVGDLVE